MTAIIEAAARAMLEYEAWLGAELQHGDKYPGTTGWTLIDAHTADEAERRRLSGAAIDRAKELRGGTATGARNARQRARRELRRAA
jgi:hypothetical protein